MSTIQKNFKSSLKKKRKKTNYLQCWYFCVALEGKGLGNFTFENQQMNKIYVLIIVFEA